MIAEHFNASVLVNQGLRASSLFEPTSSSFDAAEHAAIDPGVTDVLDSFRSIAREPLAQQAAPELAGLLATFGSTTDLAAWAINAKYAEVGGADGALGRAVGAATQAPGKAGFVRGFQNGAIHWHPQAGAHSLHGPILARWRELGAENGFLGYPTSDVTPGTDVRAEGLFAHFQGGSIYWSPPSQLGGAIADVDVHGGLLSSLAGANGAVSATVSPVPVGTAGALNGAAAGLPSRTSDTRASSKTALDGAAVMLSPLELRGIEVTAMPDRLRPDLQGTTVREGVDLSTVRDPIRVVAQSSAGAFEVHGAIREKYLALGAEASILGYPRTDESATPDGRGRYNHFQGGSIYWTADTGAHEVHGLIRDRWSALGWERNPQLGYPITDELIPDPRIGHRRPEVIKKPIVALPAGVIKLPAAASAAGFPASVVNTPLASAAMPAPMAASAIEAGSSGASTLLRKSAAATATSILLTTPGTSRTATSTGTGIGALSTPTHDASDALRLDLHGALGEIGSVSATLDPAIIGILNGPVSTPGQRSVNRFADFEGGVLFWFRGATSASVLTPLSATRDGTSLAFSGADIAAIALARIGRPAVESANAHLQSMSFVGTTGYSNDGIQIHNRRHRLQLVLAGTETRAGGGLLGSMIPQVVAVTATIEAQVEAWFDAAQRRIVLALVDWSLQQASSQAYGTAVALELHSRLDPLLWKVFEVMTLPDTDGGSPVAVLSVKTLANGAVVVFVEPRHLRLLDGIGDLANAVDASVVHFAPPR